MLQPRIEIIVVIVVAKDQPVILAAGNERALLRICLLVATIGVLRSLASVVRLASEMRLLMTAKYVISATGNVGDHCHLSLKPNALRDHGIVAVLAPTMLTEASEEAIEAMPSERIAELLLLLGAKAVKKVLDLPGNSRREPSAQSAQSVLRLRLNLTTSGAPA